MNTNEMIAVMQAYARGEAIEVSIKGRDDWCEIKCPLWDWNSFEYRVTPKESEFKTGDSAVFRRAEADTLALKDIHAYGDPGCTNSFVFWKVDDVLWYWEFKMSDGWHISQTRMTRAQARAFVGDSVDIAPLYALGFRTKDEK